MKELEMALGIKQAPEETINSLIEAGILFRDADGNVHCVE